MRNTNSGPTVIPADQLTDIVRSLNFSNATPAPHQVANQQSRILKQPPKQEPNRILNEAPYHTRAANRAKPPKRIARDQQQRYPLRNHQKANPAAPSQSKTNMKKDTEQNSLVSQQVGTAIKVVLRVRPLAKSESVHNNSSCVAISEDNNSLLEIRPVDPKKHPVSVRNAGKAVFKFSKIFDETSNQSDVFEGTTLPIIENLFKGQNAVVFAYGVTSSGKTWTIQGSNENPGILPRALDVIVNSIAKAKGLGLSQDNNCSQTVQNLMQGKSQASERRIRTRGQKKPTAEKAHDANYLEVNGDIDYKIFASYIEVYNEQCYDLFDQPSSMTTKTEGTDDYSRDHGGKSEAILLDNDPVNSSMETGRRGPGSGKRRILKLKDDGYGGVYADGQTEVEISSTADIDRLLAFGQQNRKVAHTKANQHSSRSHAMFIITLKQCEHVKLESGHVRKLHTSSKLYIVDLAGSERTSRTDNVGERLKEAAQINTSLMVLGRCLSALRQNQRKLKHDPSAILKIIPYRQSRLTRLLHQTFISGSAVMIANVSPSMIDADETIHALRCAAIASEVTTAPTQKRTVLADCTNTLSRDQNSINENNSMVTSVKEEGTMRKRTRRPIRMNEKSKQAGNLTANALEKECIALKEKLNAQDQHLTKNKKELSLLRMERDEAIISVQEKDREIENLAEENEKLFRENERLTTRNGELRAHFRVIESEVREELMHEADEIFKEIQERHDREIKELIEAHEDDRKKLMDSRTESIRQERVAQMRRVTRASLAPFEGINAGDSDEFEEEDLLDEESDASSVAEESLEGLEVEEPFEDQDDVIEIDEADNRKYEGASDELVAERVDLNNENSEVIVEPYF